MSAPSRIFIVGPRGSGKSKFAELLAAELLSAAKLAGQFPERDEKWPIAEMSAPLIEGMGALYGAFFGSAPPDAMDPVEYVRANKDRYRPGLIALGDFIAGIAPDALLTHCAKNARIIVGVRRRVEVNEFYARLGESVFRQEEYTRVCLSHRWVYIERPGMGLEWDRFEREFFQTSICRHHVTNNGDLELLRKSAAELARELLGLSTGSGQGVSR